jgi:hypothetical protein
VQPDIRSDVWEERASSTIRASTPVLRTRQTRRPIPGRIFLHNRCSENLKSHSVFFCCIQTPLLKISTELLISLYIRTVIKWNSPVIQHIKKRSFSCCSCYELLMPHSAFNLLGPEFDIEILAHPVCKI